MQNGESTFGAFITIYGRVRFKGDGRTPIQSIVHRFPHIYKLIVYIDPGK